MIVRPICPGTQTSDINLESVLYKTDTDKSYIYILDMYMYFMLSLFLSPKGRKLTERLATFIQNSQLYNCSDMNPILGA